MLAHDGHQAIARLGTGRLQRNEARRLFSRHVKPNGRRAHHRVSPLGDMLGTLDVATDGFGTDVCRRADVVRRRPRVSAPQPFLQCRKFLQQAASRDALEHLDGIGYCDSRRDAEEQVNVIGLNPFGDHRSPTLLANRVQHCPCFFRHRSNQYVAPTLRTPDQIGKPPDRRSSCYLQHRPCVYHMVRFA